MQVMRMIRHKKKKTIQIRRKRKRDAAYMDANTFAWQARCMVWPQEDTGGT